MSKVALELAQNLVSGVPGVDTVNLYISISFVDNELMFVEYKYKDKETKTTGFYGDTQKGENGVLVTGDLEAQVAESNDAAKGPCLGAFIIRSVSVRPRGGWGRLLYYIAMHYSGRRGITSDKEKSSADAVGVWNKLFADSEVKRKVLDDINNPQTPEKEDDCNLSSSGIYGYEKSKTSYQWNPSLSYGDEKNVDPEQIPPEEERLKKGEEYRKIKASKLNYVYYGSMSETINLLARAGKLEVNGQQIGESVKLANILFKR